MLSQLLWVRVGGRRKRQQKWRNFRESIPLRMRVDTFS
jgi:hypothetical protein